MMKTEMHIAEYAKAMPDDDNNIAVLIADDHKMIAEALKSTLSEDRLFSVALVDSLSEALDMLRNKPDGFDLVLLDVSMPGMQGLRSVKHVVEASGRGSVVIFSGTAEPDFVWQAIELGAKGYISKDQPLRSLPTTLRLIADGHEFVPLSLTRRKLEKTSDASTISEQDRLILKSVSHGKTNKEIAIELDQTEIAIKMKMRAICGRLNARNRAHAVIIATQAGII